MNMESKLIHELIAEGYPTFYSRTSALNIYLKKNIFENYIYLTTAAPISIIRKICKEINYRYKTFTKINKTITELLVEDNIIIYPMLEIEIKNSYSTRKPTDDFKIATKAEAFNIDTILVDKDQKIIISDKTKSDIENKIIKFNGNPYNKIVENRLYMLRAGYLLSLLGTGWAIDYESFTAIKTKALEIAVVSTTDIGILINDVIKFSEKPSIFFEFLINSELVYEILPELTKGINLMQTNKASNLDLVKHIMLTLDSINKNVPNYTILRWVAIFHDLAKPYTTALDAKGNLHFYGHDKIGSIFAARWLEKYKLPKIMSEKIIKLCKYHLFDARPSLSETGIKKLIDNIGTDLIFTLIDFRIADRLGTGRPNISMTQVEKFRQVVKNYLSFEK